jgi:hypothetical protein
MVVLLSVCHNAQNYEYRNKCTNVLIALNNIAIKIQIGRG